VTRIAIDARKLADFGIGTHIRGLLLGLAEVDRETTFLLLGRPEARSGLPELPPNFEWVEERAPGYSARELWSLSRTARRAAADLFHAPHYVLPFRLPCPAVVTIHDLIHRRFPEHRSAVELLYARRTLARALRTARAAIAVSETTRREIVERFGGALASRLVTIPNGVDQRFREPAEGLPPGLEPGYLLFVGNPKPHKNLEVLLAAHARLRARNETAPQLVIAGGPAPGDEAQGAVRRLGRVDDAVLPALYRSALALVVPSLWEGFGLPAAEAMAAGTPVLAADRGALPEVVGDAALLFDPTDVAQLEERLARIVERPDLRRELAERGPRQVAGLTWRAMAEATLALYRRILAEAAPARGGGS